ncbi:MAG: Asp-tRNA(Asn)/Glu-tRNA(Gln) amidotransferase subunit GatA [Oscillospiraceae bacterium]|nr:Asp-tRNA(Asn)/Glu-tRNA(Gln) amidotransferase subunit GatA [Oscillospiraceae bacterium]
MNKASLTELTAFELHGLLKNGDISADEVSAAFLSEIKNKQTATNAFITVCEGAADAVNGTLAGLPYAAKDNISTKGIRTTCASRILSDYVPVYDATVIENLRGSGARLLGKLNMDEFAMGSTSETSYFGAVRNPWDVGRSAGGSSGGAAAAVAAGMVPFALGSDTGGSIRQPSSFCGVTGIKPTYGAVSRYGLIAYGSSLDQIGPVARDARSCALALSAMAGEDLRDGTSEKCEITVPAEGVSIKGKRIALPKEAFADALSAGVRECVLGAVKTLEGLGAVVEWVRLPMLEYAVAAYYIIASAEAASNLSRYDGIRYGVSVLDKSLNLDEVIVRNRSEGFGREVKRRLMLGNFALSAGYYDAYYNKALRVKALLAQDFARVFADFDFIIMPTAPGAAPKLGESLDDPLAMYLSDAYTVPINLAGLPALSMPCGLMDGMPVGAQLIGKRFADSDILAAAAAYQDATDFHMKKPSAGATEVNV